MASSDRDVEIWDLPTRIFHWTLVILVGTNLFLIGPRGGIQTVLHFIAARRLTRGWLHHRRPPAVPADLGIHRQPALALRRFPLPVAGGEGLSRPPAALRSAP